MKKWGRKEEQKEERKKERQKKEETFVQHAVTHFRAKKSWQNGNMQLQYV